MTVSTGTFNRNVRNEFFVYLAVSLSVLLALTVPALLEETPDLQAPERRTPPTVTNTQTPTQTPPGPSPPSDFDSSFLTPFTYLIGGIVSIIGIFLVASTIRGYAARRTNMEKRIKKEKEKIRHLKDAREEAYRILKSALQNQKYTESFIEAYQALDNGLDYFREIARPKYITPKEYSFSVRSPVFRPSVYDFVKIFYNIRYGGNSARREDIEVFIGALDRLFEDEVDPITKDSFESQFEVEMREYVGYRVRTYDPRVPFREEK